MSHEVRLQERVPAGHLLRRVDAVLDLGFVRELMAPHYARNGRPLIDPELMVRMLLVGYLYGIRSERRVCEEVGLNLAYRWLGPPGARWTGARSFHTHEEPAWAPQATAG